MDQTEAERNTGWYLRIYATENIRYERLMLIALRFEPSRFLLLPLRKNLLGSKRIKAINIYLAFILQVLQVGKQFATANSLFILIHILIPAKGYAFMNNKYHIFVLVSYFMYFYSKLRIYLLNFGFLNRF